MEWMDVEEPGGKNNIRLTLGQKLFLYFCNFCGNTSIHGYKFLSERNRNIFEKIYWFLIILGAIFGSSYFIYSNYIGWVTSPIIVTFAMTETPIWNIPFPAITICSETAIDPSMYNFTDVYLKYRNKLATTEEEDFLFKMVSLICNDNLEFINETETKYASFWDFLELYLIISDVQPISCKWMGDYIDYDTSFSITETSEGMCTTFNMLEYKDVYVFMDTLFENRKKGTKTKLWSLEEGYPPNAGLNAYPRRTIISGINGGFQVDFELNENMSDYLCSDIQGFKVALHHPAEIPNMDRFFRVPLDQVVVAGIKPKMITTSNEIKSYKSEERQCYMPGEKNLTTFKIYSQQNCLAECIANFTFSKCDCIPFYLPDPGDKICGVGSRRCLEKAKVDFLEEEINSKLNHGKDDIHDKCGCMPACTSIEFDSETSQSDWDWKKEHRVLHGYPDEYYRKTYRSRLLVYYKELQFMTLERHELYGTVEFLGNCGGLLGLCCGFSFISLMEIIYYLTLRLWSNIYKFGCKYKFGFD